EVGSAAAGGGSPAQPFKLVVGAVGLVVTAYLVCTGFLAFAWYPGWFGSNDIVIGLAGLVLGIGGAGVFFLFLNMAAEGFPRRLAPGRAPYAFVLRGLGPS